MMTPDQRRTPTCSFKSGTDSAVTTSGETIMMALASARGTNIRAVK